MCRAIINDKRLTPTMDRVRSGSVQFFKEGEVEFKLQHERKEMYAELINGKWYWVSGCGPCNGEERSWRTYIECEEHDVCRSCLVKSKYYKGTKWGGSNGWICDPCKSQERLSAKLAAFERLDGEEPDCLYRDEIICPHCGSELSSYDRYENQDIECDVCEGEIGLEVHYIFSYSTTIKGKRVSI